MVPWDVREINISAHPCETLTKVLTSVTVISPSRYRDTIPVVQSLVIRPCKIINSKGETGLSRSLLDVTMVRPYLSLFNLGVVFPVRLQEYRLVGTT